MITGVGTVNAALFGAEAARAAVMAYDYTVLAGTQGHINHKKTDRLLGLAEQWRLPVVFSAEGGGGRPGRHRRLGVTGLDVPTFAAIRAPVGPVAAGRRSSPGRCFAGNAAMLGCCDVDHRDQGLQSSAWAARR